MYLATNRVVFKVGSARRWRVRSGSVSGTIRSYLRKPAAVLIRCGLLTRRPATTLISSGFVAEEPSGTELVSVSFLLS